MEQLKMNITINNVNELNCAIVCSAKNDVRNYLNGVLFTAKGKMIGTDGHRLAIFNNSLGYYSENTADIILPFTKPFPKTIDRVVMNATDNGDWIVTAYSKGKAKNSVVLTPINGKFPETEQFEKLKPDYNCKVNAISLNWSYMHEIAAALQPNEKYKGLPIRMINENQVLVDYNDSIGSKIIIMTMKI